MHKGWSSASGTRRPLYGLAWGSEHRERETLTELVADLNQALGLTTRYGRLDPVAKETGRRDGWPS